MFLKGYCGRECNNDLDLIYGVLGCLLHTKKSNLRLTITSTWKTFLLGSLGNAWSKGASVPRGNQLDEWSPITSGLPSWVPDWRIKRRFIGSLERDVFFRSQWRCTALSIEFAISQKSCNQRTLVDTAKMIATSQFASWKQWKLSELQSYISKIRSLQKRSNLVSPLGCGKR
jgi:hypothetical protein